MHPSLEWVLAALVDTPIRRAALIVYLFLMGRAVVEPGKTPFARVALKQIAAQTGLNLRTVQHCMRELQGLELISVSGQHVGMSAKRPKAPNVYHLIRTPPAWQKPILPRSR